MEKELLSLISELEKSIVNSPHLAVMILDKDMKIVWHNKRFGEEFKESGEILGKRCFDITTAGKPHAGCPLKVSQKEGRNTKGYFDMGDKLFFFLTIPLKDGHAAKVHTYLDKSKPNNFDAI
ncbi:MAG: hypothetical protein RDU76_01085 [Candidatus Edwardsbacteria bacterium]|nr:hypothetical protein [Candidatus Edwardsbacteria bacterium]